MKKKNQNDLELEMINLDETSGWNQLEIEAALAESNKTEESVVFQGEITIDEEELFAIGQEEPMGIVEEIGALGSVEAIMAYADAAMAADVQNFDEDMEEDDAEIDNEAYIEPSEEQKAFSKFLDDEPVAVVKKTSKKSSKGGSKKGTGKSVKAKKKRKQTLWDKVAAAFQEMTVLDGVIGATGVVVLAVAIVTVSIFSSAKTAEAQLAAFAAIGEDMEYLTDTGSGTLLAMADSERWIEAVEETEEETVDFEYEEKELEVTKTVNVNMKLTSVQKDLKIKFVNYKTGKLISSVPFQVSITDSNNVTKEYKDDDKDGIIYLKDMAPGKASVTMMALSGEEGLAFNTAPQTISIKDKIEYTKIDVAEEVKTESEVNAAIEDTAQATVIEAELTDTVEWVASSKKEVDSETTYEKVEKKTIANPADSAKAFVRMTTVNGAPQTGDGDRSNNQNLVENNSKTTTTTPPSDTTTTTPPDNTTQSNTTTTTTPESTTPTTTPESTTPSTTPTTTPESATPTTTPESTTPSTTPTTTPESTTPSTTPTTTPESTTPSTTPTTTPESTTPSTTPTTTPESITETTTPETSTTVPETSTTESAEDKAKKDTVSLLKDKSGEQMYLKNSDGKYVEAKYADYYNDKVTFYKKVKSAQYVYTGWQEIDGKTYFFTKDHEKVKGEQVIQGAKYTFDTEGALQNGAGSLGIDVSKWNGNINWSAVKNSGVSYVIIRCGYRGSTTGAMIEDPKFKTNIQGALNAGLKVGIYFFSQAVNEVEAVEEASMTIGLIKKYNITYPVFLDVESSGGRGDHIDKDTRTKVIKAFCETMKNSGYKTGVYANKTWLNSYINAGELSSYKIWLAQYNTAPTYAGKYDMWQYTSKGRVDGISGYTDMNLSYMGY